MRCSHKPSIRRFHHDYCFPRRIVKFSLFLLLQSFIIIFSNCQFNKNDKVSKQHIFSNIRRENHFRRHCIIAVMSTDCHENLRMPCISSFWNHNQGLKFSPGELLHTKLHAFRMYPCVTPGALLFHPVDQD